MAALFVANGWFVETKVLALAGTSKKPTFELDVWAAKWGERFSECWKFLSCKNTKRSAILKPPCEEIHSHLFMNYPDKLSGRVDVTGYLAFAKRVKKDDSPYQGFKIVSPVSLDVHEMADGFTRFDEPRPETPLVFLYLLLFLIVKFYEEKSVTLRKISGSQSQETRLHFTGRF